MPSELLKKLSKAAIYKVIHIPPDSFGEKFYVLYLKHNNQVNYYLATTPLSIVIGKKRVHGDYSREETKFKEMTFLDYENLQNIEWMIEQLLEECREQIGEKDDEEVSYEE